MIDKVQKIRKEVARIQLYTQSEVLKQVLDYIDEVQKEPVSELWHDSNNEQPKAESDVAIWDGESGEILTRCVKVNPNRKWAYMEELLNKKEESISEDLEEAAWFYADMKAYLDKSVFTPKEVNEKRIKLEYNWEDIRIAFKAGAKWQFKRVNKALLSEVLPCFMHGGEADEVVAKLDEVLNKKK